MAEMYLLLLLVQYSVTVPVSKGLVPLVSESLKHLGTKTFFLKCKWIVPRLWSSCCVLQKALISKLGLEDESCEL